MTPASKPSPATSKLSGGSSTSEARVLHDCLEFLARNRIFAWRNNTGAMVLDRRLLRWGHPGSSDIIGVAPDGRFLAVECKSPTGRQSADQKLFEQIVTSRGGIYVLARSVADLAVGLALAGVKLG